MNVRSEQPIHLAGVNLGKHRHVCAFFQTQDQEDKVIVPFLKEGIDRGEKAFCVVDHKMRKHVLQKLSLAGIEGTLAEKRGQLEVKRWDRTVVREGHFDQDTVLALIQDVLSRGRDEGFELTRFVGRMEWALEYGVEINELVEFETRVNHISPRFQDPLVCVYNLAKCNVNAGAVLDILRTHPLVIIGDLVAENPFFVPPEAFLQELSERVRRL
jgi:hypothetical protein